jgi:ATP-dependent Clp protease adaptor protein ClpS
MSMPTAPTEIKEPIDDVDIAIEYPWVVIVWNDPINTIEYVTFVLQKLFGYGKEKAEKMTMDVHEKGRAAVSNGNREKCEMDVFKLHEHGLWATMEQDK